MSDERDLCPTCGESVPLEARQCRHCKASLLIHVELARPVVDGRKRYHLARALANLGPPLPSFDELQNALGTAHPRVVRGVTRSVARRALGILEASGVQGREVFPERGALRHVSFSKAVAAAIAALIFVSGLGWFALQVLRDQSPAPPTAPSAEMGAGDPPAGDKPAPLSTADVARLVLPSAVAIRCSERPVGSGFFVTEELILTNAHVLCTSSTRMSVALSDGHEMDVLVERYDRTLDLALLRAEGAQAQPLPLGDVGLVSVGDKVVVVGSPIGLEFTLHEGTVSSMSRSILGVAYVQIDAKINPGNSGGPLVDAQGRAIGVVSMKAAEAEGIGLALPINYAYSGVEPLVPAPPSVGESQGFQAMVAQAQESERRLVDQISSLELRPGIIGGHVDQYRRLAVRIARPARSQPRFEEMTFKVWHHGNEVCTLKGDVKEWKLMEQPAIGTVADARVQEWLKKNSLDYDFYEGEAAVRLNLCSSDHLVPGIELELEGGDAEASRIILR